MPRDGRLDRDVAIKIILPSFTGAIRHADRPREAVPLIPLCGGGCALRRGVDRWRTPQSGRRRGGESGSWRSHDCSSRAGTSRAGGWIPARASVPR